MKKASCVVAAVLAFVGYVGAEPVLFTEDGRWTVPTNQWDHVYAASNGLPEVTDARWVTGGYQSTTPGNVNYVRIVNDEKEGDVLMLVHTNSSTADNRWPLYQMQVEPGSGTTNELITVDMRFRLADDSQPDTTSQLALGLARPRLNGTAGRASWYLEFAENGIKKNGASTVYGPALGLGWHTVRVVIDVPANRAKVYLDHLAVPVISGWSSVQDASVANNVMFGDNGTALQGMAGIKFLRWTTRELAEPATWLHRGAADPAGEGWSYEPRDLFYTATNSVLPEASSPAWVKSGFEPGGSSIVTDEITGEKTLHLIMTNMTASYGYARYFIKTDEGTFATNHITTCRMRFRLVDETQTDDRYQLNCGLYGPRPDGVSGRQAFYVMFSKDRVRYYDNTVLSRNYMVDLGTNWHEMIWTQNWRTREASFYLDGSPEPVFTHLSSQEEHVTNETTFGDGSSAIYGIARVSEFHLTRQGVVWSGGAEEGTNYWEGTDGGTATGNYVGDLPEDVIGHAEGWTASARLRVVAASTPLDAVAMRVYDGTQLWSMMFTPNDCHHYTHDGEAAPLGPYARRADYHIVQMYYDPAGDGGNGVVRYYDDGWLKGVVTRAETFGSMSSPKMQWGSLNSLATSVQRWNWVEFAPGNRVIDPIPLKGTVILLQSPAIRRRGGAGLREQT